MQMMTQTQTDTVRKRALHSVVSALLLFSIAPIGSNSINIASVLPVAARHFEDE